MIFLRIAIHLAHISWMIALGINLSDNGTLQSYMPLVPLWALAFFFETLRWEILGRKTAEIQGCNSLASTIDSVNRDLLQFSWYAIAPAPSFKFLTSYSQKIVDFPQKKLQCQVFARFWLKSEITPILFAMLPLSFVLAIPTSPNFFALGHNKGIAFLLWIVLFGSFGKLISVVIFSIFTRLHKGY